MGYGELVRALEEETERQERELAATSIVEAHELLEAAARDAARARAEALAAEVGARDDAARRIDAALRLDAERARVIEMRRLLAEIREEAERRLAACVDEAVVVRLADELLAEVSGGGWQLCVDRPYVDAVRRRAGAVPVTAGDDLGGALATLGGRTLDNRLRSRLRRAWADLEPELGRLLFGGGP